MTTGLLVAVIAIAGFFYTGIVGWPHLTSIGRKPVRLNNQSNLLATEGASRRLSTIILPFAEVPSVGIKLYLPAPVKDIKGIGYHESSHTKALSLEPIGRLVKNDNVYKMDVPLDKQAATPAYYVMESRGEYAAATTVADIAMTPATPVLSPVNGTVTRVESIVIYDVYDDVQIEVMPEGHPELRVAFLHVDEVKIKVGDTVLQGKTAIGIARDWRGVFASELDDYINPPQPHVHVQLNNFVPDER